VRIAYISDQKFFTFNKRWYTTASLPINEYQKLFSFASEWVIFGRFYILEEEPYWLYDIPNDIAARVEFIGFWNMEDGWIGYLANLFNYIKRARNVISKSDIVWLKLSFVASIAYLFCRRERNRVVIGHLVGHPILGNKGKNLIIKSFSYISYLLTRLILCRSDIQVFVSNYLAGKFCCPKKKYLVANESRININHFVSSKTKSIGDLPKVLYVGRLSVEKGIVYLIEAIKLVNYELKVGLIIVGEGDYIFKLRRLVNKLELSDRVTFKGYVKWGIELFSLMRDCDCLVLPSLSEGMPLVIIEAMSQGLPIIASNVGGIPEIVKHKKNGLLVPARQPDQIASSILEIIRDSNLRNNIIEGGIRTALRNTLTEQVGKIAEEVRVLLKSRNLI